MRLLIAITTCHKLRDRAAIQRNTWIPYVKNADVRFFLGGGEAQHKDEIILDCPDDYKSLKTKTQKMFAWAVEQGYDFVFRTDDDVFIVPERLLQRNVWNDYIGRVRAPSRENLGPVLYGAKEMPFCSGFGYWLSKRAASIVAKASDNGDWAEDRFTGQMLARNGILPVHDPGIVLWPPLQGHYCTQPNIKCAKCHAQYCAASVVCPHERVDVLQQLSDSYRSSCFIPTFIENPNG